MENRRTEPRMLCADLVEICWTDSQSRAQHVVANLEDISLSGACLQVEAPMPVGSEVRLSHGDGELYGSVCYSASCFDSHFVGIEFYPGYRWSPVEFVPMHLLDPRELVERAVDRSSRI